MIRAIYNYLYRLKASTGDETNGRHVVTPLILAECAALKAPTILDVGAGYGKDILAVKDAIPTAMLSAVEGYQPAFDFLRKSGVNVASVNLERESLPFNDEAFDIVMCNQVLEHVKELFWVVSELSRVCKVGGCLVIGVPNLGSLHNRVLLLFGQQPSAIHVFGPHVRGFTNSGLCDFLEATGSMRVERIVGSNFYPFSPKRSRPLARLFPGFAVSSFLTVRKLTNQNFLAVFETPRAAELVDTPYFRGPDK